MTSRGAGRVSSWMGCILSALILLGLGCWTWQAIAAARSKSLENDCRLRLRQIGVYCDLYRSKFGEEAPTFKAMYRPDMATDMYLFVCPVTGSHHFKDDSGEHGPWDANEYMVGYEYRRPEAGTKASPGLVVAWDRAPHPDGKRGVLYRDGKVETLDQAAFERALAVK